MPAPPPDPSRRRARRPDADEGKPATPARGGRGGKPRFPARTGAPRQARDGKPAGGGRSRGSDDRASTSRFPARTGAPRQLRDRKPAGGGRDDDRRARGNGNTGFRSDRSAGQSGSTGFRRGRTSSGNGDAGSGSARTPGRAGGTGFRGSRTSSRDGDAGFRGDRSASRPSASGFRGDRSSGRDSDADFRGGRTSNRDNGTGYRAGRTAGRDGNAGYRGDQSSSRAGKSNAGARQERPPFRPSEEEERAPRQWGSLARKGTRQLKEEGAGPASLAWREAVARSRTPEGAAEAPDRWEPEVWVRDSEPAATERRPTKNAKQRKPAGPRSTPAEGTNRKKPKKLPPEVTTELTGAVAPAKAARLQERLADATGAYERDRYRDAARILKPLAEMAPGVAAVRELYGLAQYRLGNWNAAITELEAFRALSGSYDQHPTLADAYRAKKRWQKADELWEELRQASPGPELVAEGRIVQAGALADRGKIAEAIELLERAKAEVRKPRPHHLRTWYALADLYERAGEVPRARELFRRVLDYDAELYDAAERLAAIG